MKDLTEISILVNKVLGSHGSYYFTAEEKEGTGIHSNTDVSDEDPLVNLGKKIRERVIEKGLDSMPCVITTIPIQKQARNGSKIISTLLIVSNDEFLLFCKGYNENKE